MLNILARTIPVGWRQAMRRVSIVNWFLRYVTKGLKFKTWPGASHGLWYDGYRQLHYHVRSLAEHEPDAQKALASLFGSETFETIWDVGANIGFWTILFGYHQQLQGRIIAYEPDTDNLDMLNKSIVTNRLVDKVLVRPLGLSSIVGEAELFCDVTTGFTSSFEPSYRYSDRMYKSPAVRKQVAISTIDQEVLYGVPPPNLLKIDVEGHELSVLRGGIATFKKYRPFLLLEMHQDFQAVYEFLSQLDYEVCDLNGVRIMNPDSTSMWLVRPCPQRLS